MPSRKIRQIISGQMTVFRGKDVVSSRDNSSFPALNVVQSIKDGDDYVTVQSAEIYPFSDQAIALAETLKVEADGRARVVGTIELSYQSARKVNGRTYSKWNVTSFDLTPASEVPYAEKQNSTETETAEAPANAAAPESEEVPF